MPASTPKETLLRKIEDRSAVVGVIGLGYVGLPFAVLQATHGFRVIGIDENATRVAAANAGKSYVSDVPSPILSDVARSGKFQATTGWDALVQADIIVICVPTPLTAQLTPDLQFVTKVARAIAGHLRAGQLVCLESTTYPGTTEEVMRPILESSGLACEKEFFLAHSPERIDPGNRKYVTENTTKIVGGIGPGSLEVARAFYARTIATVVPVGSAKVAEIVKVYENTFRAVNIALANELAQLCDRMGLDVWEVLEAAHTKPFGIMPFHPGPGVGGHCIPIDPHYLEWKAKEFNFQTRFIALAGEINRSMPQFVRRKTHRILNELGIAPSRAKVLVLGLAYKRDVSDWRESPALEVVRLLKEDGVSVSYHDPHVPEVDIDGATMRSVGLTQQRVREQDLVLITTDHTAIDYDWLVSNAQRVFDTRNATKRVKGNRERITLL